MAELLTVTVAAERLALSPATLRRWITDGRIGFVKLGKAVRIRADEVESLARKNYKPATAIR